MGSMFSHVLIFAILNFEQILNILSGHTSGILAARSTPIGPQVGCFPELKWARRVGWGSWGQVSGPEGRPLCFAVHSQHSTSIRGTPLPYGTVCGSLGLMAIILDAIAHRHRAILVCQDDIVVPDGGRIKTLENHLLNLPKDWDVFYPGFCKYEGPSADVAIADGLLEIRDFKRMWNTHFLALSWKGMGNLPFGLFQCAAGTAMPCQPSGSLVLH